MQKVKEVGISENSIDTHIGKIDKEVLDKYIWMEHPDKYTENPSNGFFPALVNDKYKKPIKYLLIFEFIILPIILTFIYYAYSLTTSIYIYYYVELFVFGILFGLFLEIYTYRPIENKLSKKYWYIVYKKVDIYFGYKSDEEATFPLYSGIYGSRGVFIDLILISLLIIPFIIIFSSSFIQYILENSYMENPYAYVVFIVFFILYYFLIHLINVIIIRYAKSKNKIFYL